jgi:hypothetical protein
MRAVTVPVMTPATTMPSGGVVLEVPGAAREVVGEEQDQDGAEGDDDGSGHGAQLGPALTGPLGCGVLLGEVLPEVGVGHGGHQGLGFPGGVEGICPGSQRSPVGLL